MGLVLIGAAVIPAAADWSQFRGDPDGADTIRGNSPATATANPTSAMMKPAKGAAKRSTSNTTSV